jgi:AraC-like DNA-binding protein
VIRMQDFPLLVLEKDIDILGLHSFYYLEHTKDFYTVGEKHDFWEMVYVDMGEISVIADNAAYTVRQGEIIFHKPMEFHLHASNRKNPHNLLVVSFSVRSTIMDFFNNKIFLLNTTQKSILHNLLAEGQNAFAHTSYYKDKLAIKETKPGTQQLIICYLEQFLISLLRSTGNKHKDRESMHVKKDVESALVQSIENYLTENVYEKLVLADVCAKYNLGKSYLCKLFLEETGQSIIDYYIGQQMTEAKKLIRIGNYNFTQISDKLQYSTLHCFTRAFSKHFGMSPSNYKKSL